MSKVMKLKDAIAKYVENGDVISLGGFTTNRKPYAAVNEILRQGQKDFIVEAGPAGGDWDTLIGAGRVKAYINCYTANSGYTNVSRRFRAAVEKGELLMEDYSQDVEMQRIHAAALGLPYLPCRLMMGSSLVDEWGISKEEREKIDKLPNDKFIYVENPFKKGENLLQLQFQKLILQ
ncbi:MAG: CoA-transferase [Peptoniphilus harei]|nr:CoA-transferase [Peptoniphilus harei]